MTMLSMVILELLTDQATVVSILCCHMTCVDCVIVHLHSLQSLLLGMQAEAVST